MLGGVVPPALHPKFKFSRHIISFSRIPKSPLFFSFPINLIQIQEMSTYSRKDKSLGLLCSKFIALYDSNCVDTVGVDNAAFLLGVEKRRIYDIVNILESVGVMRRKAKNQYTWNGLHAMPAYFKALKKQGLQEKFDTCTPNVPNLKKIGLPWKEKCSQSDKEHKRDCSLGILALAQNFLKLLLCSDVESVSFDHAGLVLIGESHEISAKTKFRRLYDIANVFLSMGLVEKTQGSAKGKAAFKWLGTEASCKHGSSAPQNEKSSKKRMFGNDVTNTVLNRFDLSENSNIQNCTESLLDNTSREMHKKSASKEFDFGPFAPTSSTKTRVNQNECHIQDCYKPSSTCQPQYHNQAISKLFDHYAGAYKSWFFESSGDLTR